MNACNEASAHCRPAFLAALSLALLFFSGCAGVPTQSERQARGDLKVIEQAYWPGAAMPPLDANAGLSNYLQFAIMTQPEVRAAYFDWAASVERITVERSLPDPKADVSSVHSRCPHLADAGLDAGFSRPGQAQGRRQRGQRRKPGRSILRLKPPVLTTAFSVKQAYYQLWFLDEKIRINRQTLNLLADLEKSARAQNEVGKVTLQDVYRAQIEQDKLATEISNLEDSRRPLTGAIQRRAGPHARPTGPGAAGPF